MVSIDPSLSSTQKGNAFISSFLQSTGSVNFYRLLRPQIMPEVEAKTWKLQTLSFLMTVFGNIRYEANVIDHHAFNGDADLPALHKSTSRTLVHYPWARFYEVSK